jgi:hypothetical protein
VIINKVNVLIAFPKLGASASEDGNLGFLGGRTIMVPPSNEQREDPLALPPLHGNIGR